MFHDTGARCYQAPHWIPPISGLPDAATAAETLIRFGYLETAALTGLCRAWRNLFDLLRPDLLFCDFAPTALLAARGRGIPTAVSDTGYGIPPACAPLPLYRWWLPNPPPPLPGAEERVLATMNTIASVFDAPPYAAVHEVFRGDRTFLCTFRELDHYPDRTGERYHGVIAHLTAGQAPAWPQGKEPRVFAYLQPEYPGLTALLSALVAAKVRVVAFVPGLDAQTRDSLRNRRLTFAERPVRMDVVRDQCDAAVCHAGLGTTASLLSGGRPLLLLPTQLEQGMIAMRVQQLGAGLACDDRRLHPSAATLVGELLGRRELRFAAQHFAQTYRDRPQAQTLTEIVDESLALLR